MPVTRPQKEAILKTLTQNFGKSKSVVFAANQGLTVSEISELRGLLREQGIAFQIAKKTLILKACTENNITGITKEMLEGPIATVFSFEDEVAAAKILAKFAKSHKQLVLIAGVMEGKAMGQSEVISLAKLPSKEELIAKLIGTLIAPVSGFVGIGNGLISGFVRVLDGVRKQKESV